MESSQGKISDLAKALSEAQMDIVPPKRDSRSDQYGGYSYASLGEIILQINGVAREKGLVITQFVELTKEGIDMLVTDIIHIETGQHIYTKCRLPVEKPTAQGFGSAITYMRKYQLMSLFFLAPEDDDGRSAENSPGVGKAPSPPATPPAQSASGERHITAEGVLALLNNANPGNAFEMVYSEHQGYVNHFFSGDQKKQAKEIRDSKRAKAAKKGKK